MYRLVPVRRPNHFWVGALVVAAWMLALPSGASAADSSQSKFEKQYLSYLKGMGEVAQSLEGTPQGRAAIDRLGIDPVGGIAQARADVKQMSPAQLGVLKKALRAVPDWREHPDMLEEALDRSGVSASANHRRTFAVGPNCDPGPGTPLGITDYYIAAGVALAAEIVHVGIPDDVFTSIAQVAAAAAWGVAATAALVLEGLNAVETECNDAKLEDFIRNQLDVKVSTRMSQTSFDAFKVSFDGLDALINSRLDVAVSTRASQVSLNTFQNQFTTNATVVNNKLDTLATTVGDQGALALRLEIESDLSETGDPVALFELPAASGGHLDLVRVIVVDIIEKMKAANQDVGRAEKYLLAGDAYAAAGKFKKAYRDYGKAYREAAGLDGDHDSDSDDGKGDD